MIVATATLSLAAPGLAEAQTDLTALPIEQLMNIEVTSVTKKPQKLSDAAAAIYVITQEDIRRSGMTTVPELLRMVPGLDVAQIDANTWAISSRGMNGRFADKLLVLIDGRSVYTITDSGVNWDVQNVMLADVERIEVIRGPGGALWGANAVNGVINIITKKARDTQGLLASVSTGNVERPSVTLRYGMQFGASSFLRIYGQGFARDRYQAVTGVPAHDGWDGGQIGFRFDLTPTSEDTVMAQGELYRINSDDQLRQSVLTPPSTEFVDNTDHNRGGHALVRWDRRFAADSDMTLQAYYDRADRLRTPAERERVETYDVDFQHHFQMTANQQVVWGLGYRSVETGFENNFTVAFTPAHRRSQLFSAFVDDEILLGGDLRLTVGSKFEHNSFTGFEYQPSARLLWQASPDQSFWAAVSRAVQTPGLFSRDFRVNAVVIPDPLPAIISIQGNPAFQSEDVLAFEAGYCGQVARAVSLDIATFYNRYDKLTTADPAAPYIELIPSPPHLVIPIRFNNLMHGETYGVEVAASWQVTERWKLSSSYTWFQARMRLDPPSVATDSLLQTEGSAPEHQFQVHSRFDLPHNLELDGSIYYVGPVRAPAIPSYARLDLRLGWRPRANLEFSIVGQNLLNRYHQEFDGGQELIPSRVPRSFYAQIATRF